METFFQYYNIETDPKRADWVQELCVGPKRTLHSVVPIGFEHYIRILHPAWLVGAIHPLDTEAWKKLRSGRCDAEEKKPVQWSEVAMKNGHDTHRQMKWYDIAPPVTRELGKAGIDPPLEGELTENMVERLFETFIEQGDENQEVLCGFWEGYGYSYASSKAARFKNYDVDHQYVLLRGTLASVRDGWLAAHEQLVRNDGMETSGWVPNAVWPTTCEWYLAVEYHLMSSYLGGPASLIKRIRNDGNFETYEALPGDKTMS